MFIEPDTQRTFTRIHFDHKVSLEFISDSYDSCQIKNLSLTGMFATGAFQKHEGKHCLVNLVQTGIPTDLCLQASAKVIRKSDEGLAIKFTSMPFDSYMLLQAILLSEGEYYLAARHHLSDENCPFEITDQLPITQEANCLTFLQ